MVASAERARRVRGEVDLCLEPPVQEFDLLDWQALERLVEAGYAHARQRIAAWRAVDGGP